MGDQLVAAVVEGGQEERRAVHRGTNTSFMVL